MKKGGAFLLFCLLAFPVLAQTNMDQVFQQDNPNVLHQGENHPFTGSPLVYLEGVSDIPQPKTWEDNLKMRLFGSMEVPNKDHTPELNMNSSFDTPQNTQEQLEITPTFGAKRQIVFVPHTPDWHFVITATDNNAFNIHEDLSFITKDSKSTVIRDWPIEKDKFQLVQVKLDGKILTNSLQNDTNFVLLKIPFTNTGIHKLQLDYIILTSPDKNDIQIPLIGKEWPFLADTFSGIIFNNSQKFENPEFLIGSNQKTYPENFTTSQDAKGNIFFKMNKILPSKTQIKLKTKSNLPMGKSLLDTTPSLMLFYIIAIIGFVYILSSALEIKYMPLEKKLKKFHSDSHSQLLNFIKRNMEIIIGSILLILFSFIFTYIYQIKIDLKLWMIIVLIDTLTLFIMDYIFIRPVQKEIFELHKTQQERIS